MSLFRAAFRPQTWTEPPGGSTHVTVTTLRPPLSALKSSSLVFLYLLPLIGHSLGLQYKHAPPTCLRRSGFLWPHADRRHTNTATAKSTDKTQSAALMDGRPGSRGQGGTHPSLFLCLVSQRRLLGCSHLCPALWKPSKGPRQKNTGKTLSIICCWGVLQLPSLPPHCAVMSSDTRRECDPLTL